MNILQLLQGADWSCYSFREAFKRAMLVAVLDSVWTLSTGETSVHVLIQSAAKGFVYGLMWDTHTFASTTQKTI